MRPPSAIAACFGVEAAALVAGGVVVRRRRLAAVRCDEQPAATAAATATVARSLRDCACASDAPTDRSVPRTPDRPANLKRSRRPRQRNGRPGRSSVEGSSWTTSTPSSTTCGAAPTAWPTSCSATGASPRTSPRRRWRARSCAGRRSRRTPSRGWFEWQEILQSTGCASGNGRAASRPPTFPASTRSGRSPARAGRALAQAARSRGAALPRRPPGSRGRADARLLGRHGEDARVARARRVAEVVGGRAVSDFDFDALRDPDRAAARARASAPVSTRGRGNCARATRRTRIAVSATSIVAVVAIVLGVVAIDARHRADDHGRRPEHDAAADDHTRPPTDRRSTSRFIPPTTTRERARSCCR